MAAAQIKRREAKDRAELAEDTGAETQSQRQAPQPALLPLFPTYDYDRWGTKMLRGGIRTYTPCVLDQTGWHNYFLTLPYDYDIRNDPVFDCKRSTYKRLMDVGAPVPEPTTSEMLRTGQCGPDPEALSHPAFLRDNRELDQRPDPAYKLHLADRTKLHYMRADPLEGVLPYGRQGDMLKAKSITHRDYKWRVCCRAQPPSHPTFERKVHRYARTDIHGRNVNEVVKFDDDFTDRYFGQKLMKLKKAYLWPKNPITGEALGGHLLYHQVDPCMGNRKEIWPCGEMDIMECNPICIPEDRCQVLANRPSQRERTRPVHFNSKSYLDMRYPIRNYECWEEAPDCCGKPENFPTECCFKKGNIDLPCPSQGNPCPPKEPCSRVC